MTKDLQNRDRCAECGKTTDEENDLYGICLDCWEEILKRDKPKKKLKPKKSK